MKIIPQVMLLLALSSSSLAAETKVDRKAEVGHVLDTIATSYAYLAIDIHQFAQLREAYLAKASEPMTNKEYVRFLEQLFDQFHDHHLQLSTNLADSFRLVPSGTALVGTWRDGAAVISALAPSAPAFLGSVVQPGDVVVKINGAPVDAAVAKRLEGHIAHSSTAAREWALNSLLAGRRNEATTLELKSASQNKTVTIPPGKLLFRPSTDLSYCRLSNNAHYIRINDSLGRMNLIKEFGELLPRLSDSDRIVMDLRDTPSGGNSLVARAILGHFVATELPYQKHELPGDERSYGVPRRWLELVSPIVPRLSNDVQVLVGPWTGSMGEGLAIGFDATRAGKVMGTRMAGLKGATSRIDLPSLGDGKSLNLPTEKLFHINGTAREAFLPEEPLPSMFEHSEFPCQKQAPNNSIKPNLLRKPAYL